MPDDEVGERERETERETPNSKGSAIHPSTDALLPHCLLYVVRTTERNRKRKGKDCNINFLS